MRKAGAVIFALLILLVHSAFAEVIRLGKTDCLLQPAAEEDTGKRYVLFAGSGDYFFAIRKCADIAAKDGMLLIPQGDSQYVLNSRASDVVIRDIRPQLLAWAEAGYEMNLVGYSSGGYPAVELARELAEEGYTGKLFILDGPTVGVDIGAKAEIHSILHDLASRGIGIIVISDDLPELVQNCNRILVMKDGRPSGILDNSIDEVSLGKMLIGA